MSRIPPLVLALALVVPVCSCEDGDETGPTDSQDTSACADQETACDQVDDDCDGLVDEGLVVTVWADSDRDGYGDASSPQEVCELGDGLADNALDCDDENAEIHPAAPEVCNGVDDNCDEAADEDLEGTCAEAPLASCLDMLGAWPLATDGLFWVDPTGSEPVQVYCDLAGGGWTLVYRGSNAGGLIENGVVDAPDALGETPITPTSEGHHKLHDDVINALRTGSVENDLRVVVFIAGEALSPSYHPSACVLQSGTDLATSDVCNESTTVGPNETSRNPSGHSGSLTRWYVDNEVGYIWGAVGTHVGPIEGGTGLGQPPGTYCTWYDSRSCPSETALEIWAL